MQKRILILGGAGFIGSHLTDELLENGYRVRVLDNLDPQVHSDSSSRPDYLSRDAELMLGDIRDSVQLRRALADVDAVFHLAAKVGVGQSMYQVSDYVAVNDFGTAVLLQCLIEQPVQRLVVASSMSIYGEGLYRDSEGQFVDATERSAAALGRGDWEPRDLDGRPLTPVPTPETKRPALSSIYAMSKYVQERNCLIVGQAYGMETVALRFFNVYGTRQALSNPYTGVMAIFASRLLNGRSPMVFEDGQQQRDFVHVRDVARACRLALEVPNAPGKAYNIGSGQKITVSQLGERLAAVMDRRDIALEITGRGRTGDIRHCFADISLAERVLGFRPEVNLDDGLAELVEWLAGQTAVDRFDSATDELKSRGLVV